MPTGYTAKLYDGEQSFADYAMGVARGFGALVTMRDDPADAEIPEAFEPASYYVERVDKARAALDAVSNASEGRLQEQQAREIKDAQEYRRTYLETKAARFRRYDAMLEQARAYVAPTPDHRDFAKTLVHQLEQSIEFDCGGSYEPPVPEPLPLAEYRGWQIAKAHADLQNAKEELRKEEERCETRSAWVQALRDSLSEAVASANLPTQPEDHRG